MEDIREAEARKQNKNVNPFKKANFFSKVFFIWVLPLFKYGYNRDLTEDDIYPILKAYDSTKLGSKLKKAWRDELKRKNDPSLWKALSKVFWKEAALLGIWYFFTETVVKLSQPIALAKLLDYYEPNSAMSIEEAWVYSGCVILCTLVPVLFQHNFMFRQLLLGRKVKIATSALLYEKSLKLSNSALAETTVGQMVNLISNDVGRFEQLTKFMQDLWVLPFEIVIILILLYIYVGPTGIVGVLVVLAWIPLQSWLGKKTSQHRLQTALKTDERIRLMNEILSGIQVIKMYAWERPFAKLVEIERRKEIDQITIVSIIRAISTAPYLFLTRLAILLCVFTYFLTGNTLNAKYVFVLTSFYSILQKTLTIRFPQGVMQFAEAAISIKRIKQFMLYHEVNFDNTKHFLNRGSDCKIINGAQDNYNLNVEIKETVGIHLKNVSIKWVQSAEEATLEKINLEIKDKELVALIGEVGSGKSSLLQAILSELPAVEGTTNVTGTISYACQEPWLFVGSVRQNITFGQKLDQERYNKVVKVCALQRDFALFPHGDRTIVGERGVSLSGGQRARINLARAVYKQADIYLLDDPLSAVDTHVGKHLFEECIAGYLKDKCVVLVTHQLQYLKDVQKIYLLGNGTIEHTGTFDEIQKSGEEFAKLLKAPAEHEEELSDDDDINDNTKPTDLIRKRSSVKKTDKNKEKNEHEPRMEKEGRGSGKLDWAVYKAYFWSGHGVLSVIFLFGSFVLTQAFCSIADYYLSFWVNMEQLAQKIEGGPPLRLDRIANETANFSNPKAVNGIFDNLNNININLKPVETLWLENMTESMILGTYSVIILLVIIFSIVRSLYFYLFCMKASVSLHKNMFDKIVYATMRFFNTNPSGRILNRFSMDMNQVDELLPLTLIDTLQNFLMVLAITVVIASINPWMMLPAGIIFVIFYFIRVVFLASSRDIKRLEGTTRSPVYTHLTATLHGLTTIRAFGAQEILKKEFDNYQNENSSAYFTFTALGRCFGLWLDMHCVVFVGLVTFSFLLFDKKDYGGNVGLSITQSIALTGMFQWGMRQWSELENTMTCVERIKEYADITPEKEENVKDPPKNWPEKGIIKFVNLSLRYAINEPCVLKNLTFTIENREKVGIVGRTGAGKSSIIVALFRLAENEGKIIIDNVDTSQMPLNKLRSSISIIPQEPVLFSGSLRKNLDPFDEYSDETLWNALEDVELKSVINELPGGLESFISEGGSNFSVGQRQLVCLARAIVGNNKILVLDEATANVDPHTDALIQNTIREKFAECTVLTVAHRLHTIMDSDKILVMNAGKVAEFGTSCELLNQNGIFYEMVQQTGRAMAENLTEIAKQAELRKIQHTK